MFFRQARSLLARATFLTALFALFTGLTTLSAVQISPGEPKTAPLAQASPGQVAKGQVADRQSSLGEGPEPINVTEINQMPVPTPLEFQSRGLDYEAITREGVTVMFSALPPHIKDFNII